jgi:hypothetical protein
MTQEEFRNHGFGAGDRFKIDGEMFPVASVNFGEALIGIDRYEDPDDLSWHRCESGELITN